MKGMHKEESVCQYNNIEDYVMNEVQFADK